MLILTSICPLLRPVHLFVYDRTIDRPNIRRLENFDS